MSVAAIPAPPLDAIRHCESVTRSRARNFYHGLKLLPEPKRSAMYALYAWMRAADDLVDDAERSRHATLTERIESFRELTTHALAGNPAASDPVWTALAFTAEQFNLSEEPFHAMLDGQLDDVADRRYETFRQLREYCYRVASTVGLLCIEVWGYDDPAATTFAIDRGIAFQLTNILRDFREDFDADRIYLPEEDFRRHDITPEDVRHWRKPEPCRAFIADQVDRTASYYFRSRELDDLIDPECRPTLWAMTTIYRKLLSKISDRPANLISDRRIRLSWPAKAVIALRAKSGRFGGA